MAHFDKNVGVEGHLEQVKGLLDDVSIVTRLLVRQLMLLLVLNYCLYHFSIYY